MKKPAKIALAIASIWPFVWMLLFFLVAFGSIFWFAANPKSGGSAQSLPLLFTLFIAGHTFTFFLMLAMTAFYIVYLFRTDRVPQDKKALWAVVLFFANMFAFPVFWYLYIWKEPEALSGG